LTMLLHRIPAERILEDAAAAAAGIRSDIGIGTEKTDMMTASERESHGIDLAVRIIRIGGEVVAEINTVVDGEV
jgi:hypothetical protein